MKTYVLTFSRLFPKGHVKDGNETLFVNSIFSGSKIHTIRQNVELWEKRIKEVQQGTARLSLRFWIDKPYNSKQVEFCVITSENNIGYEKATLFRLFYDFKEVAKNDGLSEEDFADWFKKTPIDKKLIIIHFTSFRYRQNP